ncbi:hypothetical protein JTE90_001297 [Oedothorax gibbosus]|uniref:Lysosome-associated membrane glycoprotein 5 n=1 Tax=Oedothorax gibbosus TaxID=931172 RepID=A0AAV6V486_9ARAC|nr:hypothetical protein JTE90_001297 [Oedothorax gibbosus]
MKIHISFILFVLLIAGVCCQEDSTTTLLDTTTQATTDSTTVSTTVTDTTTASEDTTTKVVSTTTEAPATTTSVVTTQSPATTTSVVTTQSPATTTSVVTTQSPATTTSEVTTQKTTPKPTVAPTTPVPPTTKPPVAELGSWNVTEGNTTCIRADLKIRFMIPVNGREEYIALSPNATGEGSCNAFNGTQELQITDSEYILTFTFDKNDKEAYLKNVSLNFFLPEDTGIAYNDSKLFKVNVGNSYLCSNTETVPLLNVSMEIFQIHLQAYGSAGSENFGTAEECEADDKVNDLVPIAVGCCLLALVVIVLIAYFVGRRRSRQKGYQSV